MRQHPGTYPLQDQMQAAGPDHLPELARRAAAPDTVVEVAGVPIGGEELIVIAGPCAVESREQLLTTAGSVCQAGARLLRGGAFKPRSSPYCFQGLREEGLRLLAEARQTTGLPVVTEAMDVQQLDLVAAHADMIQVGSRSMQNFCLLEAVGRCGKPVLLKRGMSATLQEFLLAAEYVLKSGNSQVVLCERGIRTFETATRNTMDLNAIPWLKQHSHLPVLVDPSHGTGHWWMVPWLSRAALAAGADGLLIEVHCHPSAALSDGAQSLRPDRFSQLMQDLKPIAQALGARLGPGVV